MKYPAFLIVCALASILVPGCSSEVPASCHEESCLYPPPPICDGEELIIFSPQGICSGDTCVYPPSPETCEFGCEAGACLDENAACRGVECNSIPAPSCEGTRLTTWSGGTCSAGGCTYRSAIQDCANSDQQCLDGRCQSLCLDVECEEQPPSCDDDVRVTPSEFYCDGGECLPATVDRFDCSTLAEGATCSDGECTTPDVCVGVTCDDPPEDWCERFVLHSYSAAGSCVANAGNCFYEDTTTNCAISGNVCVVDAEGASCVPGDPCLTVSCAEAPPAFCLEDPEAPSGTPPTQRRVYGPEGLCTLGECWHESVIEDCADSDTICVRGECQIPDPCEDVRCPSQPLRTCDGNVSIGFVRDTGVCVDGACVYEEILRNCEDEASFCENGVCVPSDPCEGVVCATPPTAYCFGNEAIEFVPIGVCDAGECYYEPIVQDCETRFDVCADGECVDP